MSVSLTQSPAAVVPIGTGVLFKLLLDSFGSDPLQQEIAFQLFRASDNEEITPLRPVKPAGDSVPVAFPVNATKAIKEFGLVETRFPTNGFADTGTVQEDTTIKAGLYLKYGDAIYDSEDCENEAIDTDQTSATIEVINSALNLWDNKDFVAGKFFLNSMPKVMHIFRDTRVWLWLNNGNGLSISHTAYYRDGTTANLVSNANALWDIPIFSLSNAALSDYFDVDKLVKIESEITIDDVTTVTYTTCYMDCARSQIIQEFYALDPLGGYNTFVGELFETNTDSEQKVTELPLSADVPDYANSGITILEKKTRLEQTYIRKFPNDEEHEKYLTAISAATKFLVRIKDESGASKISNFNVTGGINVFKTQGLIEISITGTIGTPVMTQL